MITEDYVSFETAKLLKEKGFEYNPDESYWLIDANNTLYWISSIGAYDYVDVPTESFQRPKNGYRLVTQAMAMKWLREKHGLYVVIRPYVTEEGTLSLFDIKSIKEKGVVVNLKTKTGFNSYEEAAEAGIRYCLENLI